VNSNEESARFAVADERCNHASVTSSCADSILSSGCEESASGKCRKGTLEGEYWSEFIDLLVRKGARVIQN
jgi:hypothetical protein